MKVQVVSATSAKFKGMEALRILPAFGDAELPEFDTLIERARSTRVLVKGETSEVLLQIQGAQQHLYTREKYEDERLAFADNMNNKVAERRV